MISNFSERAINRIGREHNLAICRELKRRQDAVAAA
jgi:hypothetical protein